MSNTAQYGCRMLLFISKVFMEIQAKAGMLVQSRGKRASVQIHDTNSDLKCRQPAHPAVSHTHTHTHNVSL